MIRWVQGRRGYYSPSSENPQIPSPARACALNFLGEEKISPWREPRPRMAGLGGGWGGGYDDDDDWGLSAEQLDQLERDAYRKLAERKASSSAASTATSPLPSAAYSPVKNSHHHPASRVSQESCFGKVRVSSPLSLLILFFSFFFFPSFVKKKKLGSVRVASSCELAYFHLNTFREKCVVFVLAISLYFFYLIRHSEFSFKQMDGALVQEFSQ